LSFITLFSVVIHKTGTPRIKKIYIYIF